MSFELKTGDRYNVIVPQLTSARLW